MPASCFSSCTKSWESLPTGNVSGYSATAGRFTNYTPCCQHLEHPKHSADSSVLSASYLPYQENETGGICRHGVLMLARSLTFVQHQENDTSYVVDTKGSISPKLCNTFFSPINVRPIILVIRVKAIVVFHVQQLSSSSSVPVRLIRTRKKM
jgi:hypothetical protein